MKIFVSLLRVLVALPACLALHPARADMNAANSSYASGQLKAAYSQYLLEGQAGNPDAQNMVGTMLQWGRGTAQDLQGSLEWFRRAAAGGSRAAMSNLAYSYEQGLGVPVDLQQAADWYGKAAAQKEARGSMLRPILDAVIAARGPQQAGAVAAPVSMAEIVAGQSARCDAQARELIAKAEAKLPASGATLGQVLATYLTANHITNRLPQAGANARNSELAADVIAEYAAARCFDDAARVLARIGSFPEPVRNAAKYRLASGLAAAGQLERALAVSYGIEPIWAQTYALREVVVQAARIGRDVMALNLANSLATADGWRLTKGIEDVIEAHEDARHFEAIVKLLSDRELHVGLEVDGYLSLAQAKSELNDRTGALLALKKARERALQHRDADWEFSRDEMIRRVMGMQAVIAPEGVTALEKDLHNQDPVERIWALTHAVIAAHDKPWQLQWLAHIDELARQAEDSGQVLSNHETFQVCRLGTAYAAAGEYLRAEYLMKRHHCQPDDTEWSSGLRLKELLHIAATRGDLVNAMAVLSPPSVMGRTKSVEHLEPIIYGLVRAGRFDEAFFYLKVYETGRHGLSEELVAAIGEVATPDFPFRKWLDELLARRAELQVSQWDTLRVLFAACVRNRGLAEASELANTLTADEFATAQIGIAQGLRNSPVTAPKSYHWL